MAGGSVLAKLRELASYTVRGGFVDTAKEQEPAKEVGSTFRAAMKKRALAQQPQSEEQPVTKTPVLAGRQAQPQDFPGVDIIKDFEKLKLNGYFATDDERDRGIVTVGYGSTGKVKQGEKITEEQANAWLEEHLREVDEVIDNTVKVDLTDKQIGALRSLIYNIGGTQWASSKALTALNKGDFDRFREEAFGESKGFVHQSGKKLRGLVRRRKEEEALFVAGTPEPEKPQEPKPITVAVNTRGNS